MIYRSGVVNSLSDLSQSLRERFDSVQASKKKSPIPMERFIWDYWHVPGEFTYFRTFPHLLFSNNDYNLLCKRLTDLSEELLGTNKINTIWASYYVDYCRQELHQDITQGGWAFVFNLSFSELKKFSGGKTYLLREQTLLQKNENFYNAKEKFDKIELGFGDLLIFDGQIPHGVEVVEGTHDPMEGRFVIHGWFSEPEFKTTAKDAELVRASFAKELSSPELLALIDKIKLNTFHQLTLRIDVRAIGTIKDIKVLTAKGEQFEALNRILLYHMYKFLLPRNSLDYSVILPLTFSENI